MRIVSLLPSATEIVYALGLGDDLVGVTYECAYPPEATSKPVVGEGGARRRDRRRAPRPGRGRQGQGPSPPLDPGPVPRVARSAVRRGPLGPRHGGDGRRGEPPDRQGAAVAGRDLARDPGRQPRG